MTLLLRVGLLAPMMAAAGLVFSAAHGGESQFGSSCRDTGSSDCIDDHHGTGIEVFDPSEKKARSDQQIVFGIVGGVKRAIRAFNKQKTENARFEEETKIMR